MTEPTDKPSHAFRCLLSEGATRDDVQAHLQRRAEKIKADIKLLFALDPYGTRAWVVEQIEAGTPFPDLWRNALEWIDRRMPA